MAIGYLTPRRGGLLTRTGYGGSSLFDLNRQVNRLFDELLESGPSGSSAGLGSITAWPQLELEQQDDQIRVVAELPGVREDDVELTIEDSVLRLSGEKRSERKDESGYSERSYGRFERQIALPSNVDEEACKAQFENGVLTVTLPRTEAKSRGRRIPLSGGSRQQRRIDAHNDREQRSMQQAAEEPARKGERQDDQQG